ncbi:MAG: glycoside hydrolase family 36 protein [Bacilli bacterium]|jgi:alpha-galactosidase
MSSKINKNIEFIYSDIVLNFSITEEGKIVLLYCGPKNQKIRKIIPEAAKFYSLVEASYLGEINNKTRGLKHFQSGYAETYKYVSHQEIETSKGRELVIVTKNNDMQVETHYRFYKDAKSFTSFNIVENTSEEPTFLTFLSSFTLLGVCPANDKNTFLYEATNSWLEEAQWQKHKLFDLGIFDSNSFTSMKRYCINNTGSWSTKEHLPMMIFENKKKKIATLVQVENNGSWHLEIANFLGQAYLSASGPEFNDNQWIKKLAPGERFESVHATLSFGQDFEETIQEITKARRMMRRDCEDLHQLPVIFNDYMHALWDTQTTDSILPLVDIASKVGCDEFCIDAGWFAKGSNWWDILGLWQEEPANFPNGGLKYVIDYIKSKGMKAGIWIEIEAAGINSPILEKMKDGWLFQIRGIKNVNNKRYQLNFANKEVYRYAMNVIDELMKSYNLDYLKIDYNVDSGPGNDFDSDSIGDGLLKHNRAYIRWLNEVMDKYPHLTIENCGSGGNRMDYEILKYCPIQSTSDQTNYRKYPYLATNVFTACTPEQAAVWSYPLNDYEKIMPTDEVVIMNMCNAMLGRIHLASFINKLPESQLDLIKEGIRYYKVIAEYKKNSVPVYPHGTAHYFDKEVIGGLKNKNRIILGVWNTSGKPRTVKVNLNRYGVNKIKVGYPASHQTKYSFDKATNTLAVTFDENYGGRIFELDALVS